MRDRFSSIAPVIDDDPVTALRDPELFSDFTSREKHPAEQRGIAFGSFRESGNEAFWDDKRVDGGLRVYVAKGKELIGFEEDLSGDLASSNFFKNRHGTGELECCDRDGTFARRRRMCSGRLKQIGTGVEAGYTDALMKRLLRVLTIIILTAVVVLGAVAGAFYLIAAKKRNHQYEVAVAPSTIPVTAGVAANGERIALIRGCIDCHGADLGGKKVMDNGAMGRMYGTNLTRGKGGIGAAFSETDWIRAIRHGVNPAGHALVLMPSQEYSQLSEQDLADLTAYIESVPPVDRETVPIKLGPISTMLIATGKMRLAANRIDHANVRPSDVAPALTPEYGKYLATSCQGCHGVNFSGGRIEAGPPSWPHAPNLTPGGDGAVSGYTQEAFVKLLRDGRRPNDTEISPIMPRTFGQMSDDEIHALWLYLKSIPAAPTGSR